MTLIIFFWVCRFQLSRELHTGCELGGDNARNRAPGGKLCLVVNCDCMKILHTADFQFNNLSCAVMGIEKSLEDDLADFL